MNAEFRRIKEIFLAAVEKPDPAERDAYLREACGQNEELRRQVDALLGKHAQAGSFLESPAPSPVLTVDEPPAGEAPGSVIGSYKLIEQIGEGGMGTVWMAQQTEPVKRLVALKLIKAGMDSKQVIARFEAERQALALMDHANIARVLDGGTTGASRPYFVMDLVKGVPITRYCDEHRLTPRQRLELFVPVCQAIQHAHQKGIIHRDLKPSNVLVALYDGRPVPKVIDFGVAKAAGQALTEKTLVTGFGAIVGTLEYMSPEQAEVNQLDIDTRSDIYSLGVLLYELLAGSPPFTRKALEKAGMLEMLRVIREQEPTRPSAKLSTAEGLPTLAANRGTDPAKLTRLLRGELDWIVMKALEKDRNRRYETANGFAMDVQRYLADEPVLACPPSGWYRFSKFARRNRSAMLVIAGVLALMVVAGAGIWSWQYQEGLRRAERDFHTELTRRSVTSSLEQLAELHSRALWQQAEVVLDQADKQLGLDGNAELRERLAQARRNTAILKRLDEIRLGRLVVSEGKIIFAGSSAAYSKAFLENGFDVLHGDCGELAAKLNASAVRDYLLAALDDWAVAEGSWEETTQILAVTAAATGQAWRSQITAHWKDEIRLAAVFDAIPENERTPAIIVAVAYRLTQLGQNGMQRMESGLRQYPGNFWLHVAFGMLQSKERADVAIGAYRAALAIRPRTAPVRINLGNVLFEKNDYDGAIAEYKEAIRLDPKSAQPHNNLGNALHNKKEYDAAIAEYKEAIRLDPKYAVPHNNLGNALHNKKEYDAALAEFKEAIRLDPKWAVPHNGLGNFLHDKKKYDAAIAEYKEAIRLDPKYAVPHDGVGCVLRDKKEYDAAIAEYKGAIRLDPQWAVPHVNLGNVLCEKRDYDAAITEFKEAIRLDPKLAPPHNNLGTVLYHRKEYDAAITEYKEAIRLDPGFASHYFNLGTTYWQLGRFSDAVSALDQAAKLMPNDAHIQDTLRRATQMLALDQQLSAIRQGSAKPKTSADAVLLARFASLEFKKEYGLAVHLFADAFDADAKLMAAHRYDAACAACLAAAGQGKDLDKLDDKERAELRRKALGWLRDDLQAKRLLLEKDADKAGPHVIGQMRRWLADPDLTGVREPEALAKLPEAEQQAWQMLWRDVAETIKRAQGKATK
jgi:serine/threonine protein kinase/tetratricopeptide (TPR) repeat protein